MRVVVALACLYAGVAISDPHPGTEVSQQAAGQQAFPFFRRGRRDNDDDDDSGSGSGSDDEGPRRPWSRPWAKTNMGSNAQRPRNGRNDYGEKPRGFGGLGIFGKLGKGGKSPWDRFRQKGGDNEEKKSSRRGGRRKDDDDDEKKKSPKRGGRGKDSDSDDDETPSPKRGGRGKDDDSDDDEKQSPKPSGPGKGPGRGKGSEGMTRPVPKGSPVGKPKDTSGGGSAPPPPKAGNDAPPAIQGPPRVPTPQKAPPAQTPKGQGGRSPPMPGGLSPAERYERLAGSLGAGIWKQAPTPGGNCPKGIYHPKPYTTFQYLLNGRVDIRAPLIPGIETYIIDMFETTKEDIDSLHRQGRKAICYFNAGGSQEGNPDNGEFLAKDKGGRISKDNGGGYWPGENWVDTTSQSVRNIMFKRIQMGLKKGCLGFEFDNVDAYENDNRLGKRPSIAQAAEYVKTLCGEAHRNCMSCNLKNSPEMINLVNSTVQYYVNEECVKYKLCNQYHQVGLSKPIFHIEYTAGKLTGLQSGIVPGSNREPTKGEDDGDSDDEKPRQSQRGGFGGRGGGQQSGAAKWGGKSKAGQAGGGRPKSGGLFSGFFGKMMRGKGQRLSRRAEQAEQAGVAAQADKLDGGNKGEHKNGETWYCPVINGMSSILGHEGLEGEIQTCGGLVHRTRTVR